MIWIFEAAGMAALALVVWVQFRAARERPDQQGLRVVAWLGAVLWLGFCLVLLVNGGAFDDPLGLAVNALIACVILCVVMGYRRVLGMLKARAGGK